MTRPTARVLAMLELLQTGGQRTVGDLAARLGVDERTVRRYAEHLAAWLELMPAPQLLVLNADDLFARPDEVFVQVQQFLGIPVHTDMALTTYNSRAREPMAAQTKARLAEYYRPYNAQLYELLGRNFGWEARYPS